MATRTTTELLVDLRDSANASAWTLLNSRYRPIIVGYARRCGLQDADAQDIAQDTLAEFLRAYQAGNYDRDRGSRLRDWLKGFAANRVREFHRKRAKSREHQVSPDGSRTDLLLRVPDQGEPGAWDQEWTAHLLSECVRAVQVKFDAKTLRAFELYGIQQRPADEVAGALGMTRNAVYIAKSRVLERMRTLFVDFDARLGDSPCRPV
jgi:RNA polymerase sigma-70 factor (ECF subfamily)